MVTRLVTRLEIAKETTQPTVLILGSRVAILKGIVREPRLGKWMAIPKTTERVTPTETHSDFLTGTHSETYSEIQKEMPKRKEIDLGFRWETLTDFGLV